jgi:uncharacterized Zn finger protein
MYFQWKPYVSVAQRRAQAVREMKQLEKGGLKIQPISLEGRKIARTFWGQAWCNHFESLGDYSNRLPRGRSYVRNGSVCHLAIEPGQVVAKVSGSEMYNVKIKIDKLPEGKWADVKQLSSGQIGSLLELLQGKISRSVMEVVTNQQNGLFPLPREIKMACDCPDYARMCKHIAAVLYGVGARLDQQPELLFVLRGVNHLDLISASANQVIQQQTAKGSRRQLAGSDLGDVFGIELDAAEESPSSAPPVKKSRAKRSQNGTPKASRAATTKRDTAPKTTKSAAGQPAKVKAKAKTKVKATVSLAATTVAAASGAKVATKRPATRPRVRKPAAAKKRLSARKAK